jgi:Zn finger protein HypA/HybF involved in hydrogenase expression
MKKLTDNELISKFQAVHGDVYDYSRLNYKGFSSPVTIGCRIHGDFFQRVDSHLSGQGCPKCGRESRYVSDCSFVERARKVHGDRYDYSRLGLHGMGGKVSIICREHGEFKQRAADHLKGHGCPACAGLVPVDFSSFLARAKKKHGDRYDYSKVKYIDFTTPVEVVCPLHGSFMVSPKDHVYSGICPKCSKTANYNTLGFVTRALKVHGNLYSYAGSQYINNSTPVRIWCREHGYFWQTPSDHLQGKGCPFCGGSHSKIEHEVKAFLEKHGQTVELGAKFGSSEFDLLLPKRNMAFEFNGVLWHTAVYSPIKPYRTGLVPGYHKYKTDVAASCGFKLYHIWEDVNPEVVKSLIASKLGFCKKLYARKLRPQLVPQQVANLFYAKTHRQGVAGGGLFDIGLLDDSGAIQCCMQFKKHSEGAELSRFSSRCGFQVIGGLSRLFSHAVLFLKQNGISHVVSYCDRDLSPDWKDTGYSKLGFKFEGFCGLVLSYYVHKPFYKYSRGIYNRRLFQKPRLKTLFPHSYSDAKTEHQILAENGVYPLYNSGMWKFSLDI